MKQQGRCVLPADETGRVLDRLAALEKVISPADIQQALIDSGRVNVRACRLTHEVMMWIVLAMGIFTDLPIRQVFKQSRRMRATADTPCRSALSVARQRLGVEPVRRLFERTVRPLASPETPGAFYCGMRLVAVDGTLLDVPDTTANDAAFGRPTSGKRGDGAFPQVRKLSLVEVGTHVEFALCTGSYKTGERTLFPQLLPHFVIRSLMFQAAQRAGLDTDRLSFTGCFQILKCRLPECDSRTRESFEAWCDGLLAEMALERIDPRRNRINPRVIKRKMKNWLKKRPEHRHLPPLKKTFMESVVMTI
jgi:hypothetical protein